MYNSLNSTNRIQNLENAFEANYDIIVVGGGITGSGIALDAASRGMSVALVERSYKTLMCILIIHKLGNTRPPRADLPQDDIHHMHEPQE